MWVRRTYRKGFLSVTNPVTDPRLSSNTTRHEHLKSGRNNRLIGEDIMRIGDLFDIPLSDNRVAIGHFVYRDKNNDPFIQVFDYIVPKEKLIIEDAVKKKYLFPPVITGLNAAVRIGLWHIIGKKPVIDFKYPNFISCHRDNKTGEIKNWFLYDGMNWVGLGLLLPEKYKSLEFLVVWSPYDVIDRIETGFIPFPYGDMIKYNKFTPVHQEKAPDI
jgi:hypothetical protein